MSFAIRRYFESLGYNVDWLGPGEPIRVWEPGTGCSAMVMPENYWLEGGTAYAEDWVAGAVKDSIRECEYVLPGYPGRPEPPPPPPSPPPPEPGVPEPPGDVEEEIIKRTRRPDFIPAGDWAIVIDECLRWKIHPLIVAAIGWHETNWLTHPAVHHQHHLGVGVLGGGELVKACEGLRNQFRCYVTAMREDSPYRGQKRRWGDWAGMLLGVYPNPAGVREFCRTCQQPANCTSWSDSVWRIYADLVHEQPADMPAEPGEVPVPPPGEAVELRALNPEEDVLTVGESLKKLMVSVANFKKFLDERMGRKA